MAEAWWAKYGPGPPVIKFRNRVPPREEWKTVEEWSKLREEGKWGVAHNQPMGGSGMAGDYRTPLNEMPDPVQMEEEERTMGVEPAGRREWRPKGLGRLHLRESLECPGCRQVSMEVAQFSKYSRDQRNRWAEVVRSGERPERDFLVVTCHKAECAEYENMKIVEVQKVVCPQVELSR